MSVKIIIVNYITEGGGVLQVNKNNEKTYWSRPERKVVRLNKYSANNYKLSTRLVGRYCTFDQVKFQKTSQNNQ